MGSGGSLTLWSPSYEAGACGVPAGDDPAGALLLGFVLKIDVRACDIRDQIIWAASIIRTISLAARAVIDGGTLKRE